MTTTDDERSRVADREANSMEIAAFLDGVWTNLTSAARSEGKSENLPEIIAPDDDLPIRRLSCTFQNVSPGILKFNDTCRVDIAQRLSETRMQRVRDHAVAHAKAAGVSEALIPKKTDEGSSVEIGTISIESFVQGTFSQLFGAGGETSYLQISFSEVVDRGGGVGFKSSLKSAGHPPKDLTAKDLTTLSGMIAPGNLVPNTVKVG